METWRWSFVESSLASFPRNSGGATRPAMIPNAATIATSQIAILRVRGWRAVSIARLRNSVILAAISRERTMSNQKKLP
jgi:hypothetical protein